MKLVCSFIISLWMSVMICAQVEVNGEIENYGDKEVFIYSYLNNSEVLSKKTKTSKDGKFSFVDNSNYQGILRIFLPQSKASAIVFVDNNKVDFSAKVEKGKILFSNFSDPANSQYNNFVNATSYKAKSRLLEKLKELYQSSDSFYKTITKEEDRLKKENNIDFSSFPFVNYYVNLEEKYLKYEPENQNDALRVSNEILNHLVNDSDYLEKSNLLNQLLNVYLTYNVNQYTTSEKQIAGIRTTINKALEETIVETSRGQNVLLGFIQILKGYGLDYMAEEYVEQAEALTCTITDNLKSTIRATENTKLGATFENVDFTSPQKGYKDLYEIKTKYKLVIFWGSFCPHCKEEKPLLQAFYPEFKGMGGEIISFAIETNPQEYNNFTQGINWITMSDYLYWSSPVVEKYGIEGTPSMFLLDENNTIIAKSAKLSLIRNEIK